MALILQLTDDITTIDFSTTTYELLADGLVIGFPEQTRADTGTNLLNEGIQSGEFKYGPRSINLDFKIIGTNHDDMLYRIQAITRLLDHARESAKTGVGSVRLIYKPDNASDSMEFTVISGTLSPLNMGHALVRRSASILHAQLSLECQPFGSKTTTSLLINAVANPFCAYNPGRMAISGRRHDIGAAGAGNYYERTLGLTDLIPAASTPNMMISCFFRHKTGAVGAGVSEVILTAGTTTIAYELWIDENEAVNFRWYDTTDTAHLVTSAGGAVDDTIDHHIAALVYRTDTADQVTTLMIDGQIVAYQRTTASWGFRTIVGAFRVGEGTSGATHANIALHSLYITKNVMLFPQDAYQLYLFGHHGLARTTLARGITGLAAETLPVGHDHWLITAADFIGAWPFEDSGDTITDVANARSLTDTGAGDITTVGPEPQIPCGWAAGSAISTHEGMVFPDPVANNLADIGSPYACLRLSGAYSANRYFETQLVTIPTARTVGGITIVIWARKAPGSASTTNVVDVTYTRAGVPLDYTFTIPNDSEWHQFAYYLAPVSSGQLVDGNAVQLRIGRHVTTGGSNTEILIGPCALYLCTGATATTDSVLLPGKSSSTWYDLPEGERLPITDHFSVYTTLPETQPGGYRNNNYLFYGLRGDAPAGIRLIVRNITQSLSFLAIGARFGQKPFKNLYHIPGGLAIPDPVNGGTYTNLSAGWNTKGSTTNTLLRLGYYILGNLLPAPEEQVGTHKVYLTLRNSLTESLAVASIRTGDQQIFLTGDPVKAHVALRASPRDVGLLGWPASPFFTGATPRKAESKIPLPLFEVSTLAGINGIETLATHWFETTLLPVDGGSIMFLSNTALGAYPGQLTVDEEFVVNTLDNTGADIAYFARTRNRPGATGSVSLRSPNTTAADVSIIGGGFYPPAGTHGIFVFTGGSDDGATVPLFGGREDTTPFEVHVFLEYKSRHLFV